MKNNQGLGGALPLATLLDQFKLSVTIKGYLGTIRKLLSHISDDSKWGLLIRRFSKADWFLNDPRSQVLNFTFVTSKGLKGFREESFGGPRITPMLKYITCFRLSKKLIWKL